MVNWGSIIPGPIPEPYSLYLPKKYENPVVTHGPIPSSYIPPIGVKAPKNEHIPQEAPHSWLEQISTRAASAVVTKSIIQFDKAINHGSRNALRFRYIPSLFSSYLIILSSLLLL